jgi:hypothetical protein
MPIARSRRGATSAPSYSPNAERDAECSRRNAELLGRVQDEDRVEDEVEEVDRRRTAEVGSNQVVSKDEAHAVTETSEDAVSVALGRRLLRPNAPEEECGAEE